MHQTVVVTGEHTRLFQLSRVHVHKAKLSMTQAQITLIYQFAGCYQSITATTCTIECQSVAALTSLPCAHKKFAYGGRGFESRGGNFFYFFYIFPKTFYFRSTVVFRRSYKQGIFLNFFTDH